MTTARQFVVEWVVLWTIFLAIALPGTIAVAALQFGPESKLGSYTTASVFLSLTLFVSLISVEGLRILAWIRTSATRFWNVHAPPYRPAQDYSETTTELSRDEIWARTNRQFYLSIFAFVLVFVLTFLFDVYVLADSGTLFDDSFLAVGAKFLTEIFPPLSLAATISDLLLPQDQRTATFYVLIFGVGAIPFAFPIRNAMAGLKIRFRNEWSENRPTSPLALNHVLFVVLWLLIGIYLPAWFLWFLNGL